jgi:hypothetical protein
MVAALVRGLEKRGGRLMLGAHVEQVVMEGGRAAGVALRGGGVVRARWAAGLGCWRRRRWRAAGCSTAAAPRSARRRRAGGAGGAADCCPACFGPGSKAAAWPTTCASAAPCTWRPPGQLPPPRPNPKPP